MRALSLPACGVVATLALGACVPPGFYVVHDPSPTPNAWTTVGFDLAGSGAGRGAWRACTDQAAQLGITLTTMVSSAMLVVDRGGNELIFRGRHLPLPRLPLSVLCRVALGHATGIDERVKVMHDPVNPKDCDEKGLVRSSWDEHLRSASVVRGDPAVLYDAVLMIARWDAMLHDGNVLVIERERESELGGPVIDGRVLECHDQPTP